MMGGLSEKASDPSLFGPATTSVLKYKVWSGVDINLKLSRKVGGFDVDDLHHTCLVQKHLQGAKAYRRSPHCCGTAWDLALARFCFVLIVPVVIMNTLHKELWFKNMQVLFCVACNICHNEHKWWKHRHIIKMKSPVFESFRPKLPACLCEKVALVQEARHHLVRWYQVLWWWRWQWRWTVLIREN